MNNQAQEVTTKEGVEQKPVINKRMSALLFVLVALFAGFTIWRAQQQSTEPPATQPYTQAEIEELLGVVSTRIDLPDEIPLIAEVENADALRVDQPFYKDVQNGDIVLLFATKAVIYRPHDDIIVNVGPLLYVDPSKLSQ